VTEVRGRGWGRVAVLALATMVLSVVQPALLIFVPLALLALALPPRRPLLLALAGVVLWLTFGQGVGTGRCGTSSEAGRCCWARGSW
jgi:hypothetical protein